jgi:carboxypeptidase Taq
LEWLRTHIHRVGRRLDTEALVVKATGRDLDTDAFFRHLESKLPG